MPLLSKAGSILRQTAGRQIKSELSSIHQAIRCTSSLGSSEALRGETVVDRDTGRSTGLGSITSSVTHPLNAQELHGHRVRMNYATDRPRSNLGYGFGAGYGLRSYGGGAADKVLSIGVSSKNGPGAGAGVGSDINSTVGVGQKKSFSVGATANTSGGYEIVYTTTGASMANEHGILPNSLRPLSPHLPVYKPQINSTKSILDRIAASYLTAIVLVYPFVCVQMAPICFTFEPFHKFLFYSVNLVPLSLELAALATVYHTYCGIRHLLGRI